MSGAAPPPRSKAHLRRPFCGGCSRRRSSRRASPPRRPGPLLAPRSRAHHARNVSRATGRRSRPSVQPASGPGRRRTRPPRASGSSAALPACCAAAKRRGAPKAHAAAPNTTFSAAGACSRTARARRCSSTCGMSMPTGQTSAQAPHSDEANGSLACSLHPPQLRREDRADRPRVDRAVGVPADARVHGADVQAGAAADAAQRLSAHRVGQRVPAPVVEQHDVVLPRSVAGRDPGQERHVRAHPLPGRRARQQAQEQREVVQRRDDLLDAHDGDEHRRQRGAHAAVALVLHHADGARLGDAGVGAGDAHAGTQEALAQVQARDLGELAPGRRRAACPARSCAGRGRGPGRGCSGRPAPGCARRCRRRAGR